MPKLGSKKRPVTLRVQTGERMEELMTFCRDRGLEVIIGVEPDKPEDISDIKKALKPPKKRLKKVRRRG